MKKLYDALPRVIEYDRHKYPFDKVALQVLNLASFAEANDDAPIVSRKDDTKTKYHKRWYANNKPFQALYVQFLREYLLPYLGLRKVLYQRVPNYRVQLPNNLSVGEWHYDYGHHESEINFFLPFVNLGDSNGVHIWTGKAYYKPKIKVGQIILFQGATMYHGNVPNTDWPRHSVDFRLADPARYVASNEDSINGHAEMGIGDNKYFDYIAANE